jgi:hypothetical protein
MSRTRPLLVRPLTDAARAVVQDGLRAPARAPPAVAPAAARQSCLCPVKRTDFAPPPNLGVVMLGLPKRGPPLASGRHAVVSRLRRLRVPAARMPIAW